MRWAAFRGLFYSMRQVPIALEQEQMPRKNTYTQAHRVKAHEDFQKIHDKGQSVVDGYGVFYFLPSPHDHSQLGTAVGKKLGNAVLRNKIKRRMRETFRQHQYCLKKPVSIVWVARRRLAHAPFAMYETVFLRLAKKAGLL